MKRETASLQLQANLQTVIDSWLGSLGETGLDDAIAAFGWIGDELPHFMAKAAIAVMEASADVQDVMEKKAV